MRRGQWDTSEGCWTSWPARRASARGRRGTRIAPLIKMRAPPPPSRNPPPPPPRRWMEMETEIKTERKRWSIPALSSEPSTTSSLSLTSLHLSNVTTSFIRFENFFLHNFNLSILEYECGAVIRRATRRHVDEINSADDDLLFSFDVTISFLDHIIVFNYIFPFI